MLKPSEKAYCRALQKLSEKQYQQAVEAFHDAQPDFVDNREFNLLMETTTLLVAVKKEIASCESDSRIEIEETFSATGPR